MAYNRANEYFSEEEIEGLMQNIPVIPAPPNTTQGSNTSMMPPPSASTQGAGTSGTGKRKSPVWQHFNRVAAPEDGPGKWKVTCKLCIEEGKTSPIYSWTTGQGTGTVARHLKDKHDISYGKGGELHTESTGQTQIGNFAQPGGGTPFIYNRERMIDGMSKYIAAEELPFNTGESPYLEEFVSLTINPQYKAVPRNTLQRRMSKHYKAQRAALIEYFTRFDGRVALTSDCWTSNQGEPYLCVTVHWLNEDFSLQKRIIAFDCMEESHSGFNIFTRICSTLTEFNLINKIFSISFDNASANTKCIDYFKGAGNDIPLLLGGKLVHVRCCAHIINLSAQDGIKFIRPLLDPIRKIVKWIRNKPQMKREFKRLALLHQLDPEKRFSIDTPTRWNSTYKMLTEAIEYKNIINTLYNEGHMDNQDELITEYHWNVAQSICNILSVYNEATNVFSLVYKPNVHLVILTCVQILKVVTDSIQEDNNILPIWADMKAKWINYFQDFPILYGVACLLDPGVRKDVLYNLLEFYYKILDIEYDVNEYIEECIDVLVELYKIYNTNEPDDSDTNNKGKGRFKGLLGSIVYKNKKVKTSTSDSRSSSSDAIIVVHEYLDKHIKDANHEGFDIFSWWRKHQDDFSVLTKIAKDVLVVPASTVASESAFSAGRRVINERRTCLTPANVKMCVIKRDWDRAERRQQDQSIQDIDEEDDPFTIMSGSSDGTGNEE